jgi:hypothetical protein
MKDCLNGAFGLRWTAQTREYQRRSGTTILSLKRGAPLMSAELTKRISFKSGTAFGQQDKREIRPGRLRIDPGSKSSTGPTVSPSPAIENSRMVFSWEPVRFLSMEIARRTCPNARLMSADDPICDIGQLLMLP